MAFQTLAPASAGVNAHASMTALPATQAPLVENMLVDRDGVLSLRGPWQGRGAGPHSASTHRVAACWTNNDFALVSFTTEQYKAGRFAHLNSNNAAAYGSPTLGVYRDSPTDGSWFTLARANDLSMPWRRSVAFGDQAYGFAAVGPNVYSLVKTPEPPGQVSGAVGVNTVYPGSLMRWNVSGAPVGVAGPRGGADLAVYANRIWVAGGTLPGSTGGAYQENGLFYSEPGRGEVWVDPVSNLVNRIDVDPSPSDNLVALATIDAALLLFKSNAVYRLTGSGPASFVLKRITSGLGCADAHSVTAFDSGAYFFSASDLIWHDGYEATEVSEAVRPFLRPALAQLALNGGRATTARLGTQHLIVTVTNGAGSPTFTAVYHTARRAWTLLSSAAMRGFIDGDTIGNPAYVCGLAGAVVGFAGRTNANITAWSGRYLLESARPASEEVYHTGFDHHDASGQPLYPIPARWHSRLLTLASPLKGAHLRRLIVDYCWDSQNGIPGWTVSLWDGQGREIMPGVAVPEGTHRRLRYVREFFAETTEVQFRAEFKLIPGGDPPIAIRRGELYMVGIEYDSAQPSQST